MNRVTYLSNIFITMNNLVQKHENIRKLKSVMYITDGILLKFIRKPKKNQTNKKKLCIIYNLALGDGVVFSCALQHIRKIYSSEQYEITIICQKGLNKIYENLNLVDKVIGVDFSKATVNLKERYQLFKELRKEYYDIVIDPIGPEECTTNVLMTRAVVGEEKITTMNTDRECYCYKYIYKKIYNKIIQIEGKDITLLEHYMEFLSKLGNKKFKIEFTNLPESETKQRLPKKYFIVYPSASTILKQWPVERFAEIAKRIYAATKMPVLLCGTASDKEINEQLKQLLSDIEVIDITEKTSILEFIGVVKKAKCVITNDTGIYHICVISEVPVAITAGGYTYNRYLMYQFKNNNYRKPYVIVHKMECFNCENRCKYSKSMNNIWPCLDKITTDDAWSIIKNMIYENKLGE